jgi:hypothetical protein
MLAARETTAELWFGDASSCRSSGRKSASRGPGLRRAAANGCRMRSSWPGPWERRGVVYAENHRYVLGGAPDRR